MNIEECSLSMKEQGIPSLLILTSFRLELVLEKLVFKPLGITSASFRILFILDHLGPVSPVEIVDLIGATKSNLTQRLNFLSRSGFIKKEIGNLKDRRKIILHLTPVGKNKVKETLEIFKIVNKHIESHFTKTEKKEFLRLIGKINTAVESHLSLVSCNLASIRITK
ncbi:MAG: MarR family winged helix-turn-helix transcriptional regulator [Patescibacteria group bacterium]